MKTSSSADLEFFVLLAKLGSLAASARALNISPPAATVRLAQIEQRLGVRLVNRTTRKISLTSEGEIYLLHATRLLYELREMDELISSSNKTPRGLLRINAPLGFGRTVLAPLVKTFANKFPEVEIVLDVSDKPINLVDSSFDLAIRFGEPPSEGLIARRIATNKRFICASPIYLNKFGTPKKPDDLAKHKCIIHRQNDDGFCIWRLTDSSKTYIVKVHGALSSNDGDIVLNWALGGEGILLRSEWSVSKYLESGRLQRILAEYSLPDADLFAYYSSNKNLPARARVFLNFIFENLTSW